MIFKNLPTPQWVQNRVRPVHLLTFGIIWLVFFFVFPLLMLFWESLGLGSGDPLSAYRNAFSELYLRAIARSILYSIAVTTVTLIVAYVFSYYAVFRSQRTSLLLVIVLLPLWIAYIIRYLGVQLFLSPTGPLVSLTGTDFGILFSTPGVLLGLIVAFLPFAILPVYNSMNSIDQSYIHASKTLGAGRLYTMYSVITPLTVPGIVAGGLIVFILSAGSFLAPAMLGDSDNFMIANMIERSYTDLYNIELAAALSVIYTILLLILIGLFNIYVNFAEVFEKI